MIPKVINVESCKSLPPRQRGGHNFIVMAITGQDGKQYELVFESGQFSMLIDGVLDNVCGILAYERDKEKC